MLLQVQYHDCCAARGFLHCFLHIGSESWLLSQGPYTAPAGSTLVLQLTYTASFGEREGLWRSAAYPSTARPGQQVVALSTALETSAARMVLPCLDEPRYKVRAMWTCMRECVERETDFRVEQAGNTLTQLTDPLLTY